MICSFLIFLEFEMLHPARFTKDSRLTQLVDDDTDSCVIITQLKQNVPLNDPFAEG